MQRDHSEERKRLNDLLDREVEARGQAENARRRAEDERLEERRRLDEATRRAEEALNAKCCIIT